MKTRVFDTIYNIVLFLALMPFIVIILLVTAIAEMLFPLQSSNPPTKEEWRRGCIGCM